MPRTIWWRGVEGPGFDYTRCQRHRVQNIRYGRLCFDQMRWRWMVSPTYCRVCGNEAALLDCVRLIPTISRRSLVEKKTYADLDAVRSTYGGHCRAEFLLVAGKSVPIERPVTYLSRRAFYLPRAPQPLLQSKCDDCE
jgi:hypothetical protein